MSEQWKIIRKVRTLKGRAKIEAEKQGLSPNDLVIVATSLVDGFPEYHLEKIEGDIVSYLIKNVGEQKKE